MSTKAEDTVVGCFFAILVAGTSLPRRTFHFHMRVPVDRRQKSFKSELLVYPPLDFRLPRKGLGLRFGLGWEKVIGSWGCPLGPRGRRQASLHEGMLTPGPGTGPEHDASIGWNRSNSKREAQRRSSRIQNAPAPLSSRVCDYFWQSGLQLRSVCTLNRSSRKRSPRNHPRQLAYTLSKSR